MTTGKYEASGVQAEFEPGSRGRVLRNLLGITRAEDMEVIESDALAIVQEAAPARYGGLSTRPSLPISDKGVHVLVTLGPPRLSERGANAFDR